jgi:hypothetical protein
MSVIYCDTCDHYVDTDYDVEHVEDCPFSKEETHG